MNMTMMQQDECQTQISRPIGDNNHSTEMLDSARRFLDEHCPLEQGYHQDVTSYVVYYQHLLAFFADGSQSGLKTPSQFVALSGHKDEPSALVLKVGEVHIEISFDRTDRNPNAAHIEDIQVETSLTQSITRRIWLSLLHGARSADMLGKRAFTAKDGQVYRLETSMG
ncbi:MAG: malate synthase [Shewanella sp.]|nr:malate synthase [Shewanella sp.]MCF1430650.1 malate synthase [Shewanella sp.]MCF1439492.1 malate synthase [Shewanella sp.]MCF1456959.1 malate synthase [Shewanella sp.]